MRFAVAATIVWTDAQGWEVARQVPTFVLEAANETEAARTAQEIVNPTRDFSVTVNATPVAF